MTLASSLALSLNKLGTVKRWARDSNDPSAGDSVVIDLDLNAELVPSTTPGHFHLYIDRPMPWADYDLLLQTLASVGLIEPGYYGASKARGFTAVRLPWIKKEDA